MTNSRSKSGSQLAEFGPVLFIFLMFFLFPLINLVAFATGSGTIWLLSRECVQRAASSSDWDRALSAVPQEASQIANSGLGKFAHLTPVGGLGGSGVDVYVIRTAIANTSDVAIYPRNVHPRAPIDTATYIYEYCARAEFQVSPFLNLAGVPFIGNVPLIGQPVNIRHTSIQIAEYPEGLLGSPSDGVGGDPLPLGSNGF